MKVTKKMAPFLLALLMFLLGYAVHAVMPSEAVRANVAGADAEDSLRRIADSLGKMESIGYDVNRMADSLRNSVAAINDITDSLGDIDDSLEKIR
jgi:hypothetical protein